MGDALRAAIVECAQDAGNGRFSWEDRARMATAAAEMATALAALHESGAGSL